MDDNVVQLFKCVEYSRPESVDDARHIALVVTSDDGRDVIGVGMCVAPDGKPWMLTPDQADELGAHLIRCAARMRTMTGEY